jgi:hypothetical protein
MSGLALTDAQIKKIVQNFQDTSSGINGANQPTADLQTDADNVNSTRNAYNSARTNYNSKEAAYEDAVDVYNQAIEDYQNGSITLSELQDAATAYNQAANDYNDARSALITTANHYNEAINDYKSDKTTYLQAVQILNDQLSQNDPPGTPISVSGLPSNEDLDNAKIDLPTIPTAGIVSQDNTDPITLFTAVSVPQAPFLSNLNPSSLPELTFTEFIGPWLTSGAAAAAFAKQQNIKQNDEQQATGDLLSIILMSRGDSTATSATSGQPKVSKENVNLLSTPSPQASFLAALTSGIGSSDSVTQISTSNLAASISKVFNRTPEDLLMRAKFALGSIFDTVALFGITAKLGLQNEVLANTEPTTHTGAMAMALGPAVSLLGMAASPQLEEAIKNALYTSQDFTLLTASEQNTVVNLLTTASGLSLLSASTALLGSSGIGPSLRVQSLLTGVAADLAQSGNASTTVEALRKSASTEALTSTERSIRRGLASYFKSSGLSEDEAENEAAKIAKEAVNPTSGMNFKDFLDSELKRIYGGTDPTRSQNIVSVTLFEFLAARFPPITQALISKSAFSELKTRLAKDFSLAISDQVKEQKVAQQKAEVISDILTKELEKYNNSPTSLAGRMNDLHNEITGVLTPSVSLDQARNLSTTFVMKGFTSLANIQLRESFEGDVGKARGQSVSDEVTAALIKRDELTRSLLKKVLETNNSEFIRTALDTVTDPKLSPTVRALIRPTEVFVGGVMYETLTGFHRGHIDIPA